MQNLQMRAEQPKLEQIRLKQVINDKSTASILVGLFARSSDADQVSEDPCVEELLRRPLEDIPDTSKVPELPALILPGQHASKKFKASSIEAAKNDPPNDGIDYDLLGKDRSKCTPEELDRIRRERNRMHAKRTRDRKRLFTEQLSEMCKQLEEENNRLRVHLSKIDPDYVFTPPVLCSANDSELSSSSCSTPTLSSPKMQPLAPPHDVTDVSFLNSSAVPTKADLLGDASHDQIITLLQVADAFESPSKRRIDSSPRALVPPPFSGLLSSAKNLVALSDDSSAGGESHEEDLEEMRPSKRQRVVNNSTVMAMATATVGC